MLPSHNPKQFDVPRPLATPSRPRVARVARADGPVGLRSAEHSGELTQRKQRPVIAVLVAMMLSHLDGTEGSEFRSPGGAVWVMEERLSFPALH